MNTGTIDKTFQPSGKQDFLTHIEELASIYKSSGSQFFRSTNWIQSGPDVFDKSRFVMTFLTILEILCSFRLFLEAKAGKEIPESSRLESLEKSFTNYFALSDVEDNTSRPLCRGGITDLPLLRTLLAICQKSRESSFWEVTDSFVSVAYASFWQLYEPFCNGY